MVFCEYVDGLARADEDIRFIAIGIGNCRDLLIRQSIRGHFF